MEPLTTRKKDNTIVICDGEIIFVCDLLVSILHGNKLMDY